MKTASPTIGRRDRGFTIVELLIVIVVIGVLAAITIVAYNGIQNRTHDAAVQGDLAQFAKKLELYSVDNGSYPSTPAAFAPFGVKVARDSYSRGYFNGTSYFNLVYCVSASRDTYFLFAEAKSGNLFARQSPGVIGSYSGPLTTTSGIICSSTVGSGFTAIWFYVSDAWRSEVQ